MMNNSISKPITQIGLIMACLISTNSQAQIWPQSEQAYSSTQHSPQWIEHKTPQANTSQGQRPYYPAQPSYIRPQPYAPYYGQPYGQQYGQPYYGPQGYYAPQPNYNYRPNNWGNNMPFFGNNNAPWQNGNWPSMPNMNNMSMPSFDMPSPNVTFPTMNMPFWN